MAGFAEFDTLVPSRTGVQQADLETPKFCNEEPLKCSSAVMSTDRNNLSIHLMECSLPGSRKLGCHSKFSMEELYSIGAIGVIFTKIYVEQKYFCQQKYFTVTLPWPWRVDGGGLPVWSSQWWPARRTGGVLALCQVLTVTNVKYFSTNKNKITNTFRSEKVICFPQGNNMLYVISTLFLLWYFTFIIYNSWSLIGFMLIISYFLVFIFFIFSCELSCHGQSVSQYVGISNNRSHLSLSSLGHHIWESDLSQLQDILPCFNSTYFWDLLSN